MNRETIEKAAKDYAYKTWAGGGFECASNDSFTAGADFALSHQWISVEEALPEYEEHVIALIN